MCACSDDVKPSVKGVFDDGEMADVDVNPDLHEIQGGGELIVLTLYGPDTYFEFHGEEYGNQYLIARDFAKSIGVVARVCVCRSEKEMLTKLLEGKGDIVAYDVNVDSANTALKFCGDTVITHFLDSLSKVEHDNTIKSKGHVAWAVRSKSPMLAKRLESWLTDNKDKLFEISQPKLPDISHKHNYIAYSEEDYFPYIPDIEDYPGTFSVAASYSNSTHFKSSEYKSAVNYTAGDISYYDYLFKQYAPICGLDWKLLAAVAHNESAFNPYAVSNMGAKGLMQLMPATASHYGVTNPFDPEQSVKAAAKLFSNLLSHYADIDDSSERINFALAAYNAGPGHVDDARRLAKKRGKNPYIWKDNVDEFVLYMSIPEYYNDPVVKYGYFRGGETYNYVNYIRQDWKRYRGR